MPLSLVCRVAVLTLCCLLGAGRLHAALPVGVRSLAVAAPLRGAVLPGALWYPAAAGGTPAVLGGNAVFAGTPAMSGAPVAAGRHPLVVLAYGGFRSSPGAGNWLAAGLAAQGFVVAVVTPPPLPAGPPPPSVLDELRLRPADLSAAISTVASDPDLAAAIDPERVGVIGTFLGGASALNLLGARFDPAALAHACNGSAAAIDCGWLARGGVSLGHPVGPLQRDDRIKAAVIIDPELSQAMAPASLAAITVPVSIINLTGAQHLPALNAAALAAAIPAATYIVVADAGPAALFPLCRPQEATDMADEATPIRLCDAPAGERAATHRLLVRLVASSLRPALGGGHE